MLNTEQTEQATNAEQTLRTCRKSYIYSLVDPRKPEVIRYVGKAVCPRARHLQHCAHIDGSARGEWIEELMQDGVLPQMKILDTVPEPEGLEKERFWIKMISQTHPLTNDGLARPRAKRAQPADPESIQLREATEIIVSTALNNTRGNVAATARGLGVTRQTLYNWINQRKSVLQEARSR